MSNNNRNDNSKPNYIYPQPYIDPMVYLNPYYSNATGYQYNSQGYVNILIIPDTLIILNLMITKLMTLLIKT